MQELTLPKAKPRVSPWALSPWALPQWQLWEGTNPPPRAWHGLRHWEGAGRGTGRVGSLGWDPLGASCGRGGRGPPVHLPRGAVPGGEAGRQQLFLAQQCQGTRHGLGRGDPGEKGGSDL